MVKSLQTLLVVMLAGILLAQIEFDTSFQTALAQEQKEDCPPKEHAIEIVNLSSKNSQKTGGSQYIFLTYYKSKSQAYPLSSAQTPRSYLFIKHRSIRC